ncbi:MAG: PQQ-binding-like beta-propeller repeat protein [Phycisphaerae bacterium]|nr:PQQ-binding-like beta-propeller repeat protein [Phycisphaerae bacterium]
MRTMPRIVLLLLGVGSLALAADYPQWRGPGRDGASADTTKLVDAWPKAGPVKLWTSEDIPGTAGFGYGCVSVADGRAYVYVNWKYQAPIKTRTLSGDAIRGLGWMDLPPKMPEAFVTAMEAARVDPARAALSGKPLEEWIAKWLEANIPDKADRDRLGGFVAARIRSGKIGPILLTAKLIASLEDARVDPARATLVGKPLEEWIGKWLAANLPDRSERDPNADWVADRIRRGAKAFPLAELAKLAAIRDKALPSEKFDAWLTDNKIPEDLKAAVIAVVPTSAGETALKTRTLSDKALRSLGWTDRPVAPKLVTTMEDARVNPDRAALADQPLDDRIAKWVAANVPDRKLRDPSADWAADRIRRGAKAFLLAELAKLPAIRDKVMPSIEDMNAWLTDNGIGEELKAAVVKVLPTKVDQAHDTLVCLDAANGKTLWKQDLEGKPDGWGASSTPAVVDGKVYFVGSGGDVYCRDAKTGAEVWTYRADKGEQGLSHTSVLVADDLVVAAIGPVVALNAKTGVPAWKQPKVNSRQTSPVLWRGGDKAIVLINAGGKGFTGLDLKSGDVLFTAPGGGNPSVTVSGDIAVVRTGNKDLGLVAYRISATTTQPEKLWNKPDCLAGDGSPAIANGQVYVVTNGMVHCLDVATGKVGWEQKTMGNGEPSPVVADGKLFAVIGKGLAMFRATPEKFTMLGQCSVDPSDYSSPAIANGRLFVRQSKAVACYDLTGVAPTAPDASPAPK